MLIYEDLVSHFEGALLTQLRGHNNDGGFLEMWVPDPDPLKSVINMAESAEAFGQNAFDIQIQQSRLDSARFPELKEGLAGLASVSMRLEGAAIVLSISEIGG
ncbi:MAG: hypothetical protein MO847_02425 [Candidatus Protistobacter heckmanni]|nr:hypothetical protein [Candidatus Protistobacter heckmanni]